MRRPSLLKALRARSYRTNAATDPAYRDWLTSSALTDLVRWSRPRPDRRELSQGRFPEFADVPQARLAVFRALFR